MRPRPTFPDLRLTTRTLFAAIATIAVGVTLIPTPAMAEIDAGDVDGATAEEVTGPASQAIGIGTYLSCDPGRRAIGGGAMWHQTGMQPDVVGFQDARLVSSSVTSDDLGWYADGATTASGRSFTIRVLCVPEGKLDNALLRQTTKRIPRDSTATAQATCPKHTQIITGGSFLHQPGVGPDPDNALYGRAPASFPSAGSWTAGARNLAPAPLQLSLTVYALCMPDRRVAEVRLKRSTTDVGADEVFVKTPACRPSEAELAGGAYIHKPGKGFNSGLRSGTLAGQVPPPGIGWLSAGSNSTAGNRAATTQVLCIED